MENGGDGWDVKPDGTIHSRSYAFATSYEWDTRYQEMDLLAAGFSATELDNASDITVGE